jgi:hypothetical protein
VEGSSERPVGEIPGLIKEIGRLGVRSEGRKSPPDGMEIEGRKEEEGVLIVAEDRGV